MRIQFDLRGFGAAIGDDGRHRESTRAACLAWGLQQLGERVSLLNTPPKLKECSHFAAFLPLCTTVPGADVVIIAAERGPSPYRIGYKTSIGHTQDKRWLGNNQLLIAIEHQEATQDHPCLFRAPWGVSFDFWRFLHRKGLIDAYLRNDLALIRQRFAVANPKPIIGFMGCEYYGREAYGDALKSRYPDLLEIVWTRGKNMPIEDYVAWVMSFEGGLDLPGFDYTDGAKSYRFSETLLLGRTLVSVPGRIAEDPPVNDEMAIVLSNPDVDLRTRWQAREGLNAAADKFYREHWSPLGQARKLRIAMKEHGYG